MGASNTDSSQFQFPTGYLDYPILPGYFDIEEAPEAPDFDAMKVRSGDIITPDSVNDIVEVVKSLYERVQSLEKGLKEAQIDASLPRTVLEVEGIGREEAEKLAEKGIVTLGDLASAKPKDVQSILGLETEKDAQRIVSSAKSLTGQQTGPSLVDLAGIGKQQYGRLIQEGIWNAQKFVESDAKEIGELIGEDESKVRKMKSDVEEKIGRIMGG